MKYKFKVSPFDYQRKILKLALQKKKYALWLDPGLGKTKIGVDFCGCLNLMKGVNRVLVVCPKSVKGVWQEEIAQHLPTILKLEFKITTYQYLVLHEKEYAKWQPQVVIIDESHYLKNPTAKRSKCVKRLSKNVPYQLQLTGTPQPNNYLDLWNQIDTLYPGVLGKYSAFKQRYAEFDYFGFKVIRWKNLDELRHKIRPYRVRVRKDDVLELPPRTYQKIPVILTGTQKTVYDRMKKDSLVKFSEVQTVTADILLTQMLRLQQITGGFTTDDDKNILDVGDAKLKVLEELLPTYATSSKVVVFCRFLHELNQIVELCKKLKLNPVQIRGGMKDADRDNARSSFQNNSNTRVIVCQIKAGGIGITLHAAATAIFYSTGYELDVYIQACDRIHRIGQTKPVLYLHLVAQRTIDEEIFKALQNKEKLNEVIVNNFREVFK